MPRKVFIRCCELATEYGDAVFLGGGEPTLHPLLFDYIGLALAYEAKGFDELGVGIVTNGKLKEPALILAAMAKKGIISAELSRDSYHESIDPKVVEAFKRKTGYGDAYSRENRNDLRGIRDSSDRRVFAVGRGADVSGEDGCVCPEWFVEPDGTLWGCGCRIKRMGTVFAPEISQDYQHGECSKEQELTAVPA